MMVKICGITNRDDALAAVEAGASAIGFNFHRESPRYISPTGAALIAENLPIDVWKVGVFVDDDAESVERVALQVGLDVAQLYGKAQARVIRVWRACRVDDPLGLKIFLSDPAVEALLLDSPTEKQYGGTGQTFDWSRAKGLSKKTIVAGGLDSSNVGRAIEEAQPWGVDACSRLEKSPGLKDHDKMREFIKAALRS
jgi:phosphoribosylanthranilate isomerase